MFNGGAVVLKFGDCVFDHRGTGLAARCDVDVETPGSDDFAAVVEQWFADDHDLADVATGGDDAVTGAEGFMGAADIVQRRCDMFIVVGMLVGEHKVGGGIRRAWLVAVDLLDLG